MTTTQYYFAVYETLKISFLVLAVGGLVMYGLSAVASLWWKYKEGEKDKDE